MSAKNEKWRKPIRLEKIDRFNNSKTGIILGFLFGVMMIALGASFLIKNSGKSDKLTTGCAVITLSIGISEILNETIRATKLIKTHRS